MPTRRQRGLGIGCGLFTAAAAHGWWPISGLGWAIGGAMAEASEQAALPPEVAALLESSQTRAWPDLHESLAEAQAAWQRALARLSAEEAEELRDGDWSALDLASHAVNWLRLASGALANVCVSQEASLSDENFLPGAPDLARVLREYERWSEEMRLATNTVAKVPERGPLIGSGIGALTVRQVVGITIAHLSEHAAQLSSLRATQDSS